MQNFEPPVMCCTIWIILGGSAAGHKFWTWVRIWVWVLTFEFGSLNLNLTSLLRLNLNLNLNLARAVGHMMATMWKPSSSNVPKGAPTTHNPCHILCIYILHIAKSGFKHLNNIAAVHASKNLYQVWSRCDDKFEDSVTDSSYFWKFYFQS